MDRLTSEKIFYTRPEKINKHVLKIAELNNRLFDFENAGFEPEALVILAKSYPNLFELVNEIVDYRALGTVEELTAKLENAESKTCENCGRLTDKNGKPKCDIAKHFCSNGFFCSLWLAKEATHETD